MSRLLSPLIGYPVAALDLLRTLGHVAGALRLSARPLARFRVDRGFFGVNVATGDDPALDDYIVARLRELGLTRVRLDLSYESLDAPATRLMDRLLDEGFDVLPDLLPPRDEALRLTEAPAAERWREFLQQVFERYGKRVSHFEIGTTPNRGKWSGLGSRTLLAAWHIALE